MGTDQLLQKIDKNMDHFGTFLRDDLGIDPERSRCLGSTIHDEVSKLSLTVRATLHDASSVPIIDRIDMLLFGYRSEALLGQQYLTCKDSIDQKAVLRTHRIFMCYLSFAYVSDGLFDAISSALPDDSVAKKCSRFLREGDRRAFRNAFAHGHWIERPQNNGIDFWARTRTEQGDYKTVAHFVKYEELSFWYDLSRAVSLATLLAVRPYPG